MSVLLCPQEHFKEPGLVLSMETRLGQAAPLVVAMEAISSRLPLVTDMEAVAEGPSEEAQKKPQPPSQPRRASGFLWAVMSCLSGPGGLSCRVLYCPVCLAPEGS